MVWVWVLTVAFGQAAGVFGEPAPDGVFGGKGPATTIEEKIEEKSEEDLAREARLAAIEAENAQRPSRVVVLQWRDTDTTYKTEPLQRNIKARIARPNAQFYPDTDLYQAGRLERDRTLGPSDQRATVPSSAIAQVMSEVERVSSVPYGAIPEQEWGLRANELRAVADQLWFVDRAELRQPLFLLYAQIGRAAENSNQGSPPFFENVDGKSVNYYWFLAGSLAFKDPSLLSLITAQELYQSIAYYKDQLDSGAFRPLTLSFDLDSYFDALEFGGEYEVYVNGVSEGVTNPNGLLEVPLGRADVFLKRSDGLSLSDRVEFTNLPDKFHFVRQNARKRMGIDFIQQLMENPSECMPQLSGDIVNYLAIYAKLHPTADIYIAVPRYGSTSPGRIFLWRWDRPRGTLMLVLDNTGGFPVRFAAVIGVGIAFNGGDVAYPNDEDLQGAVAEPPPPGQQIPVAQTLDDALPDITFNPEGVPIFYQLRGHYNRLMMGAGIQYKIALGEPFADVFQTDSKKGNIGIKYVPGENPGELVAQVALRERNMQRLVYGLAGVVLGRDAGVGFGPRGYVRFGWTNAPHAIDLTGHFGVTATLPGSEKDDQRVGRVRPLLDADFWGGMLLPFRDSLFLKAPPGSFLAVGKPFATFGFTAGAGLTF